MGVCMHWSVYAYMHIPIYKYNMNDIDMYICCNINEVTEYVYQKSKQPVTCCLLRCLAKRRGRQILKE
jgi:hypothetical protein